MSGSIRRRGDSWQLRAYAGADPTTRRKRYITKTVQGGKREAQRELDKLVADVQSGASAGTDATVSDLLARWVEAVSPNWFPATRRQNSSAIRVHVEPSLGHLKLSKLKAADLDRFYAELRSKPGRQAEFLSPATIRRVYVIIRAALQQALKWGWVSANVADASTPPKVRPAQIKPPDAAGVSHLLALVEVEDRPLFAFLRLAASTGARRSQLCAVQWDDIDIGAGRITFARAVVDGDRGIAIKGTKTDRVYRVTLDAETLAVVLDHLSVCQRAAEACGVVLPPTAFVFSFEPDGSKPWRPDGVSHRWTRWRDKAGLDGVRLHDLRHFMATTMLTAGVPVSVVAGRLGHARAATTLNVYSHFVEAGDEAAAHTMGQILSETRPIDGQRMDSRGPETEEAGSEDPT